MEPLVAKPDGTVEIRLEEVEAQAIRQVALEILGHLDEPPGEDMRRLFPPAYPDDIKLQDEFSQLTYDELLQRKKDAARAVAASIDAGKLKRGAWIGRLDLATVHAWVASINDARLILGTRLNVTEEMDHEPLEPDHPDAPMLNMYLYLGGMEELLIRYLLEHDLENSTGGE